MYIYKLLLNSWEVIKRLLIYTKISMQDKSVQVNYCHDNGISCLATSVGCTRFF